MHRRGGWTFDIAAPANMAADQAFGFEEFICGRDGRAVQSKKASQFPSWRELLAPPSSPERMEALILSCNCR